MYKLLSHNDLDGVGCGILAKLAFGDQVNVRYNSIGRLDQEVKFFLEHNDKDTFLFITDLSVNEENEKSLNEFYKNGGKVQLIDHHKTALHFNEYDWGYVDVEDSEGKLKSATSLLYEYLVKHELLEPSNALEEFVELVRQYDTWEWEKNGNFKAHRLNALFFLITIDEFEETMLARLRTSEYFYFNEFEQKILDMEDSKIDRYIRRKKRQLVQIEINDYFAGVVYAEQYQSELGNQLGKEYPHLDYIAILNIGSKRIGFRTIHDHVDVSEVASRYGGGGHAKASGCTMTLEAYQQFVADTFQLEPLREDAKYNRYNLKASSFGALYKDREDHSYLVFQVSENEWKIEKDNTETEPVFESFTEAEKFLKRNKAVWLVKDADFVRYLMDLVRNKDLN